MVSISVKTKTLVPKKYGFATIKSESNKICKSFLANCLLSKKTSCQVIKEIIKVNILKLSTDPPKIFAQSA